MNIIFIIIIDIVIVLLSIILISGTIFNIINMFTFYMPFIKLMFSKGIIKKRGQLLLTEWAGLITITIIFFSIVAGLCYLTRPSGYIVFVFTIIFSLIWFKPNLGYDLINIKRFVKKHYVCMNMDKFGLFLLNEFKINIEDLN